MKGISKEFPWPGARCGWIEYYNRGLDKDFGMLCTTLDNAKMIEVSSTSLPQRVIPKIMSDPRYETFLEETRQHVGQRSKELIEHLGTIKGIKFNQTNGAFYNTIIFEKGVLNESQKLEIKDSKIKSTLEIWLDDKMALDKRFVYYLLAAKNICVVPISSFCSDLLGFRITLLEEDPEERELIFEGIKSGIEEYLDSA
jgi:aspartate/methionine/tyrosine aminotransferase